MAGLLFVFIFVFWSHLKAICLYLPKKLNVCFWNAIASQRTLQIPGWSLIFSLCMNCRLKVSCLPSCGSGICNPGLLRILWSPWDGLKMSLWQRHEVVLYGGRKAWPAKQEVLVSIKCQSKAHRTDSLCYRVVSKQWCQMKDLSQTLLSFLLHARDLHRKVASQRQQQIFFFLLLLFLSI